MIEWELRLCKRPGGTPTKTNCDLGASEYKEAFQQTSMEATLCLACVTTGKKMKT
jgi:hypothetical protein